MNSSRPALPLLALFILLLLLFTLDLALSVQVLILVAFLPSLIWAGILVTKRHG